MDQLKVAVVKEVLMKAQVHLLLLRRLQLQHQIYIQHRLEQLYIVGISLYVLHLVYIVVLFNLIYRNIQIYP